jgi:hypothetical protein
MTGGTRARVWVRVRGTTRYVLAKDLSYGVSDGVLLCGGGRGSRMGSILGRGPDNNWGEEKRGKECQDREAEKKEGL